MPDCNNCNHHIAKPVPFAAHESIKATLERTIKRLWIVILVLIVLLCLTNAAWIYYESQFETQEAHVEVDTGEGSAYVAGIGDVTVGESESNSEKTNP